MIRDATLDDVPFILPLVQDFARSLGMAEDLSLKTSANTLRLCINTGICLVAEPKDSVVGIIAGLPSPNIWNKNKIQMDEIVYYVHEDHRNTRWSWALIKEYSSKVEQSGAYISLLKLMHNSPDITKHYNKLGYHELERSFVKIHGG